MRPVVSVAAATAVIMAVATWLAFYAARKLSAWLAIASSLVSIAGVVLNLWNALVNAQLVSKTGVTALSYYVTVGQVLEAISVPSLAVAIIIALSWLFPVGEGPEGGEQ